MMPVLRLFLDLCFFKRGPQDVPASGYLLGLSILLNLLVSVLLGLLESDPAEAILEALVANAVLISMVALLLRIRRHPERFTRTATAALGADAVISLMALPWLLLGTLWSDFQSAAAMMMLGFMIWSLWVLGQILKVALDFPAIAGFCIAIMYAMISMDLIRHLLGQ